MDKNVLRFKFPVFWVFFPPPELVTDGFPLPGKGRVIVQWWRQVFPDGGNILGAPVIQE